MAAHVVAAPPPADWREWLAARLQQRPRRMGSWAELALYGARRCLDAAGETTLPADALLRVGSRMGPLSATRAVIEQCRDGLPMPYAFLQSQPSQMLAAVSQQLAWQGDARFVAGGDRPWLIGQAQLEARSGGVLFGWLDEALGDEAANTEWWRFVRVEKK